MLFPFFCDFDVICITEARTPLDVYLPGYVTFRSVRCVQAHRGGTVVLVKRLLRQFVVRVDPASLIKCGCSLRLCSGLCLPFVMYLRWIHRFFFYPLSFSNIQEKVKVMEMERGYVLICDFNARFGRWVAVFARSVCYEGLHLPAHT